MILSELDILLVEDNPADVRLIVEALREGKVANSIHVASDGVEAMEYIYREGKNAGVKPPDLILLDLNLPKKDGREVLSELKSDKNLRRIPVVILTSSKAEEDIIKSYNHQANCYISKPVNFEKFVHIVQEIQEFWLSVVTLPPY